MGEPKDRLVLADGRTRLQHVLAAVEPLGLPILVSGGVAAAGSQVEGLPTVADAVPFEGPLVAIHRALTACAPDDLLVVCCDQPRLTPDVLGRLLPADGDERPAFLRCADGEELSPFPGFFPAAALKGLSDAVEAGERSPRRWLRTQCCRWETVSSEERELLRSFNDRESLRSARLLE